MIKLPIIADVEGLGKIVETRTDFYTELKQLRSNRARLISPRDEAFARLQTIGKENIGRENGTWTIAGFDSIKGEPSILRLKSRLNNFNLVEANKNNKYFSTDTQKEYEDSLKQAEKDRNKDPMDRNVIILPSRDKFTISDKENWDVYQAVLKDQAEPYFKLNGPINVYPVAKYTIDSQDGTLLTQLWFRGLDCRSDCDCRYLGNYGGARGVNYGAEGTQKISKVLLKLPYTSKQVDKYLGLVQGVRSGNLPASRLEKVVEFLSGLKQ